ncbi:MAG: SAM-dependent chlorinase/fluorinase [Woeseia sp.]
MADFHPSGVITITTDFGHKGPFTAVMKGVILQRFRQGTIVDLTHEIPAHWPPEAGFWLSRSYKYFPRGTVHVAIVDPGVGTEREILVAALDGHVFMAPDNGLLASLLTKQDGTEVYALDSSRLANLKLPVPSATFHGRDIFAPVAAELAAGRLRPVDTGRRIREWAPEWLDEPEVTPTRVSGVIVTIDAFGNLISNIDGHLLSHLATPQVRLGGHTIELVETYGRTQPGKYLALVNSFGVLEIARAEGNAAEGLGSDRGAPVVVTARQPPSSRGV